MGIFKDGIIFGVRGGSGKDRVEEIFVRCFEYD